MKDLKETALTSGQPASGLVFLVPSFVLLPKILSTTGMWLAVPFSEALTLVVILLTRGIACDK